MIVGDEKWIVYKVFSAKYCGVGVTNLFCRAPQKQIYTKVERLCCQRGGMSSELSVLSYIRETNRLVRTYVVAVKKLNNTFNEKETKICKSQARLVFRAKLHTSVVSRQRLLQLERDVLSQPAIFVRITTFRLPIIPVV